MRTRWIVSMGLAAALCGAPALAQSPAPVITLGFKADVQADGVPTNIQPDAALSPPLQAMVRKRVAEWRYRMGTWQGKPVAATVSQQITAEAVPVTGGGFALRINKVTTGPLLSDVRKAPANRAMWPPRYPKDAQRQGIEGDLVYAMRRDAHGAALEVELLDAQVPGNWKRPFDMASRQAISEWRLEPFEKDGQVIDCRLITLVTFRLGLGKPLPLQEPEPDLRPYQSRFPDSCPLPPVLLSDVAGTML